MEDKIQDNLEKKYDLMEDIEVRYVDLRKYEINIIIRINGKNCRINFIYTWDSHYTFNVNVSTICNKIENDILQLFKREVNYYE